MDHGRTGFDGERIAPPRMRIAFVIPWFGPELKGGAEQQAWQMATRMAARGHEVEVLATCCRSFLDDWTVNHLEEGEETIAGVKVRRFPVDQRNRTAFDSLNERLLSIPRDKLRPGVSPVPPDQARIWTDENINSRALEEYLAANAGRYDNFVFIPYLYGPTLRGLRSVAAKAWMQPCLHDEAYAYLPDVAEAIYASRGLLFLSRGEQEVAARLYGPCVWSKGLVVGAGIEFEQLDQHKNAPLPSQLEGSPFLLFLGRREAGKGADLLVGAFKAWRQRHQGPRAMLVLAGPGSGTYDDRNEGIVDLGLVSDETRVALLWNCIALMLPSPNESFSRVLFEAWYCGRPAVVRGSCAATRTAAEQSRGAWIAETESGWADAIAAVLATNPADLVATGQAGREYAIKIAEWSCILDSCEDFLAGGERCGLARKADGDPEAIHQLSPNFGVGDAISNEMVAIREMLRAGGYRSEIVATFVDPRLADDARQDSPGAIDPGDGVIYHHSIGAGITERAILHPGPKALIYHNITPAEYFRPYRPEFARLLRDGREDLWALAPCFPVSVGDSQFNADELCRFGFDNPEVMPLPLDPAVWNSPPSPAWMERLGDGRKNVLFVGRVAPNKRQDRLVKAFSILRSMIDARLVIAGAATPGDPYADQVQASVRDLGLENYVIVTGHCTLADMHAFFRCAHAFWSFSEHEGFCVPLVEAMWFDVPVIALASSAVPETLDNAGLAFSWTDDDLAVADTVRRVLTDEPLRARILAGQRARRWQFHGTNVAPRLARLVERLVSARAPEPGLAHA